MSELKDQLSENVLPAISAREFNLHGCPHCGFLCKNDQDSSELICDLGDIIECLRCKNVSVVLPEGTEEFDLNVSLVTKVPSADGEKLITKAENITFKFFHVHPRRGTPADDRLDI